MAEALAPRVPSSITDIGTRIELLPMDEHLGNISIALYRRQTDAGPFFRVHTYAGGDDAQARTRQIAATMETLGDLQATEAGATVRFACGGQHELAVCRVFLEACKADPAAPAVADPLSTTDRKSGLTIHVEGLGEGQYRIATKGDADEEVRARRVGVIANGLMKLGQMRRVEGADDCVGFDCRGDHDALVGLLLRRAPNVRAIAREQEAMAARGMLTSPSQQATP